MKMAFIERLLMRPHSETTITISFSKFLSHSEQWSETGCLAALWKCCTSLFVGDNEGME